MNYNTAIIPNSLEEGKPEVIAEALRSLVKDNLTVEAGQVFRRYNKAQPENYLLVMAYADILIDAGEFDEAERMLEGELHKNQERFQILLRLGLIDEKRGQNLNAFDLYQRAEELADTVEDKKEVQQAIERVKAGIQSEVLFSQSSFIINLEGNRRPLKLQYNLPQLIKRRELLQALLSQIDPRSKTVFEIECDGGVIARNMVGHGFSADGSAAEMTDILLAIGFDYIEKLRLAGTTTPNYYRFDVDPQTAAGLDKNDVIAVMPTRLQWYTERGAEQSAELLCRLATRCKRQFFFYFPAASAEAEEGASEFYKFALARLIELNSLPGKPQLCFTAADGGLLYRIDQRQAATGDLGKVLPRGLDVAGSRSNIFEVKVENCTSLNGFGFGEKGWNHFAALLEELLEKPQLTYEDSILKRFYDSFQPKNRQQQLFGQLDEDMMPLERGWTLLPWADTKNRSVNPSYSPKLQSGGNPHCGPNSTEFGEMQCKRIIANYMLIKQYGYLPEVFPDGYVQGYLLKDGSNYRFYVNEGQHRMAAIKVLGIKEIKARFNPDFLPVVDLKYIAQWPQVRRGLYSKDLAEKVFRYYFEENGKRKAKQLGLI